MVTSPVATASRNPSQVAGGAPHGNGSPLSMKWVAAYRVAGTSYSTSAGTTWSQKSSVPSSKVTTTWRSSLGAAQQFGHGVEWHHLVVITQVFELATERVDVEVDLAVRSAADTVVDQDRHTGSGLHDAIALGEHLLHDGPSAHGPQCASRSGTVTGPASSTPSAVPMDPHGAEAAHPASRRHLCPLFEPCYGGIDGMVGWPVAFGVLRGLRTVAPTSSAAAVEHRAGHPGGGRTSSGTSSRHGGRRGRGRAAQPQGAGHPREGPSHRDRADGDLAHRRQALHRTRPTPQRGWLDLER